MAKTLTGMVSSNKTDKTIVITVHTRKTHPIYKKQYTVTSKFMAHDENNQCKIGDKVSIVETKPLSARKRFTLDKVLQKAVLATEDREILEKAESEDRAKEKAAEREVKRKAKEEAEAATVAKEEKAQNPSKELKAKEEESK